MIELIQEVGDIMKSIKSALYGFAIGDALGVPVEFETRESLLKHPVTKMLGCGSYDVPKGTWSDDTSMTLATMDSIATNRMVNYNSMANSFLEWVNNAKYTATNYVFDIGVTTKYALLRYYEKKDDAELCGGNEFTENGNGSLMRMLPIAFYCYNNNLKEKEILDIVKNTSSITHAHEISILGCYIYVRYIMFLLDDKDKYTSLNMVKCVDYTMFSDEALDIYDRILKKDIKNYKLDEIKSTGYVVYTLEAVLWVVLNTNNFKDSIISSVNLGNDTDTIGAITGSITGILYGYDSIPKQWLRDLKNKKLINNLIVKFDESFKNTNVI